MHPEPAPEPAPKLHQSQEDSNALVMSFFAVRQTLGYLGLFLPASLLVHAALHGGRLEASISDFYYTGMGGVLVGTLVAIGLFLISYQGYAPLPGERLSDRWLARVAGVSALGVALFPVHRAGYPVCTVTPDTCWVFGAASHPEALHFASAIVFFACMAAFSLFQFTRGDRDAAGRPRWTPRCTLFILCGTIIVAVMVAMVPYFFAGPADKAQMAASHYLFWSESIGVAAFAVSWLAKGRALGSLRRGMARLASRA